jgi:hypothetical protein
MRVSYVIRNDAIRERVLQAIAALPQGKPYRVMIEPEKRHRSLDQNAYLLGAVYSALAEATGQEREDWHEYFLGEYFGWREQDFFGRKKLKPRRTTTRNEQGKRDVLSKLDFSDYIEFIRMRAAEHGIYIPDANEQVAA